MHSRIFLTIFIFSTIFVANIRAFKKDNKAVKQQLEMFQLEFVKMSLQFNEMLKMKTGKGLTVSDEKL